MLLSSLQSPVTTGTILYCHTVMLIAIKNITREKCHEQCVIQTSSQNFAKRKSEYFYLLIKQNSVRQGFAKLWENFMPLND